MEVVIESRKMVKPQAPKLLTRPQRYMISSIDQLQTPGYIGLLLLYRPVDGAFDPGKVRLLEEALSKALTIYYPLAGRYVEGGYYIDCGGQGVELIETKVNSCLDRLVSMSQEPDPDLLNELSNFPICVEGSPLFVVQVNKFDDGGLVIGLRFTHKVADLYSIVAFVAAWANICRGDNPGVVVPPKFDVSSILAPKSSIRNSPLPISFGEEKLVMHKFAISGKTLARLAIETSLDEPDTKLNGQGYRPPSRLEIVFALICKVRVKIDREKHPRARPVAACITMNLRGRTSVAIPNTGFGNIYAAITDTLPMGDDELDIQGYTRMVGEMMRKAKARYRMVGSAEELSSMVEEDTRRVMRMATSDEHCVVPCTSWCGFQLYEVEFEWGVPEVAMCSCPPFRQNVLIDRKVDGGIDAWVVLDEVEMEKFKGDEDIIKYCLF